MHSTAAFGYFTLPTSETATLPTAPLQTNIAALSDLVTSAATPADDAKGLGDVDFGFTYSIIATRTNVFALGAVIRMPFGNHMTGQKDWVSGRTCVYNIGYHIVWSTKYRRKVIEGDIEIRLKSLFQEIADEFEQKLAATLLVHG